MTSQFSGTWHVTARLNGTGVLDSMHLRFEFEADNHVTVYTTAHSVRHGCLPTTKFDAVTSADTPTVFETVDGHLHTKVVWTDYTNAALVYMCNGLTYFCLTAASLSKHTVLTRVNPRLLKP